MRPGGRESWQGWSSGGTHGPVSDLTCCGGRQIVLQTENSDVVQDLVRYYTGPAENTAATKSTEARTYGQSSARGQRRALISIRKQEVPWVGRASALPADQNGYLRE